MKRWLLILLIALAPMLAVAGEPDGTLIQLAASANVMLPNDEAVVRYRIEASGRNETELRQQVNRISNAVHDRLKRETGLHLTTTGRRMEPVWHYDKVSSRQVRDGWHLLQTEELVTSDPDKVAGWVDTLEAVGARLDSLNFRVSAASAKKAERDLSRQAVADFRQQAGAMAKVLGASSYRVVHLQTSQHLPGPVMQPRLMGMAAVKAESMPDVRTGESRISVTVSGEILLPWKDFPVN